MKIPLLDLKAQHRQLENELKNAVLQVLDSGTYIMGPPVKELETAIASYCQSKAAVGVSSGTDALLVTLMGLDVGTGDIVITTPYSFFASAGVIARLGATPAFVDIDPSTFNMDPGALAAWFSENPSLRNRVKAIMPVHLFGQCADMSRILAIASDLQVPVIEDAAQALGATYPNKDGVAKAGSMGLAGCFSFFPSKNLGGIGDGGMVVTSDLLFAEKIRKLRVHGSQPKYYHSLIGGNFRLDPIQAAALLVKFPHLNQWHHKRQQNAAYYDDNLSSTNVTKPSLAYGREHHIYNQYVLRVPNRRDELRTFLTEAHIGNEVYYPVPLHLQECFRSLGYKEGDFPHSEAAALSSIAIPIYPELTRDMQDAVIEKIGEFYGN